jgi:hypothetical protein
MLANHLRDVDIPSHYQYHIIRLAEEVLAKTAERM